MSLKLHFLKLPSKPKAGMVHQLKLSATEKNWMADYFHSIKRDALLSRQPAMFELYVESTELFDMYYKCLPRGNLVCMSYLNSGEILSLSHIFFISGVKKFLSCGVIRFHL